MKNLCVRICGAVLLAVSTGVCAMPTLVSNGSGGYSGASGIEVAGYGAWNVAFRDGTCAEVYSGCDEVSDLYDFGFAAQATLAFFNAFLAGTNVSDLDSNPGLMDGCVSTSDNCLLLSPYAFSAVAVGNLRTVWAQNRGGPFELSDDAQTGAVGQSGPGNDTSSTWAVWTRQVPEPGSLSLAVVALGLIAAGSAWRKALR